MINKSVFLTVYLESQTNNMAATRISYKAMLSSNSRVQCIGWPAGIPFKSPASASSDIVVCLEEALKNNEIRFSVRRDIAVGPEEVEDAETNPE